LGNPLHTFDDAGEFAQYQKDLFEANKLDYDQAKSSLVITDKITADIIKTLELQE